MLVSRIISLLIEFAFVAWTLWSLRRFARRVEGPGLACPHCRYNLGGLEEGDCPECGRPWTVSKIRDHRETMVRFEMRAAIAIIALLLAAVHFAIARSLLEIRRLLIVGDLAFIPGYSRYEPADATLALPIGFAVLSFLGSLTSAVSLYYSAKESTHRQL